MQIFVQLPVGSFGAPGPAFCFACNVILAVTLLVGAIAIVATLAAVIGWP